MKTEYRLPLLAVSDIERSVRFYCELFDTAVSLDLGGNITLECGIGLQSGFDRLTGLDPAAVRFRSNDMELYFETDDFDAFLSRIDKLKPEFVHRPKKHDWQQRAVRIYDPDGHIIEIGEDMDCVIRRILHQTGDVAETASLTHYPLEYVAKLANQ